MSDDTPPYEVWFVVEVDVDFAREEPLYTSLSRPLPTQEAAEEERDKQQETWEEVLDERGEENPYDFKGWDVTQKLVTDRQLARLERQDEEAYAALTDAANAVSASLVAEEGIGPLADDGTHEESE